MIMPRQHPRELRCNKAEIDLSMAIHKVIEEHNLTTAEQLRVVNAALSKYIGHIAKIEIRLERHGNTETPGGWANDND